MKIAVNTRLLLHGRLEGIGWVSYEILSRITKAHPEHQFYFLFDRKYSDEFVFSDNVTPVVVHPQSRLPVLWYLFFEWGIPHAVRKIQADLLVSPDGWTSLRAKIPKLTVFHDLNFEYYPQFMPKRNLRYVRHYVPKYAEQSDRIIAVSQFTKDDIVKLYNVDSEKIDVVYNAANPIYKPLSEVERTSVRDKYSEGCEYFLFVGSLHKRKNLINLLMAFDKFKEHDKNNVKMLIVGTKMWRRPDFEDTYNAMKHKDDVKFIGYLSSEELSKVMASSLALTYVSVFEGFGIPIVEAFESDTAVITSNTSSMPEIAGDAALLVDPFSIDDIAEAMEKVAVNQELRKSLIEKGRVRRKMFNWDKSADEFWKIIEKMIKNHNYE